MPLRGIVLLAFIIGSLPVCFFRPFYGILLWTVLAFLNPQSFTWSAADTIPWAQVVAAPTIAGLFVFVNGWHRLKSVQVVLMFILWIWFLITSFVSTSTPLFQHHASDTWYRFSFVSKILLMAVLTIPIVNTYDRLRNLMLVIAGCFGVFVTKSLPFVIMTGGAYRLYGPPNSMIADNNDFGLALVMTLPLYFFLAQTEPNAWVRRLCGVLFVITIPAIFFTYSRGALVGLIAISGLMFLTLRMKQKLMLAPVAIGGILIALLFAPESWKERMDPTREGAVDASAQSRLNAWAFARRLTDDFPITGGGFATFTPMLFDRYAPTSKDIHGAHSIYFQVLGEHGYVGLALYLTLIISCLITARRLYKKAAAAEDQDIMHYTNMIRFSIIGFCISGAFLGRAYFDYFYCLAACLVILKRAAAERWADQEEEVELTMQPEEYTRPGMLEVRQWR